MQKIETIHTFAPSSSLFDDINTLLIAISSLAVAATVRVDGSANYKPGDYTTIEGRHLCVRIRLPIHGPVEAAIASRKPDRIDICVVPGRDPERNYARVTSGFENYLESLFLPFMVSYFQRNRNKLVKRFNTDRLKWPPSAYSGERDR